MATALALALVVGLLGLVGISSKAYAVNSNISASVCRSFFPSDAADIGYFAGGVYNANDNPRYIICPIVRSPTSTNNAVSVYIDGLAVSPSTITCTLYSYDFDGTMLGSQSFATPVTGTFDQFLTVPGSYWGAASVTCLLPGTVGGGGDLYDIDVVQ